MTDLNLDELERDTRAVIERLPAGAEMSIEQETLLALIAAARDGERMRAYVKVVAVAVGVNHTVLQEGSFEEIQGLTRVKINDLWFEIESLRKRLNEELIRALKGGEG
jgi:hypothetical protein